MFDFVGATEQRYSVDEFGEDTSQRPNVDAGGVLPIAEKYFWRLVPFGEALDVELALYGLFVEFHSRSEVAQPNLQLLTEQDVRRFDVSMDDTLPMNVRHGFQQLMEHSSYDRPIDWILQRGYQLAQVVLAVAHHQVRPKLLFFDFEQLHYLGTAIQPPKNCDFALDGALLFIAVG